MKTTIMVGVVTLLLGGFLYFLSVNANNSSERPIVKTEETKKEVELEGEIEGEIEGEVYTEPNGIYTINYPSDYTLEEDGSYVRLYKRADAQRPQGEISDGVLIVLESIDLGDQTLEELVDSRISQAEADGSAELMQAKLAAVINGYPGFSYELSGFGGSEYLLIQKNSESDFALSITFLVSDPQQRGYQMELDSILSSLKLNK